MTVKYNRQELLTNAFLIQLTFGICCAMLMIFVQRGYNDSSTLTSMPWILLALTIISAVFAGVNLIIWLYKPADQRKPKYLDRFFYGLGFSLGCLFLQLFYRIPSILGFGYEGWSSKVFTIARSHEIMWIIIGLYILIAFIAYIIRYTKKPGGRNGNNKNK